MKLINFKLLLLLFLAILLVLLFFAQPPKKQFLLPKRLLSPNLLEENSINLKIPIDSVPRWYFNELNEPLTKETD
jgi:hypothetical protein